MSHRWLAVLTLMVLTLGTAGCGGFKSSQRSASTPSASTKRTRVPTSAAQNQSPPYTTMLTQRQLIARADPICARMNAKLKSTVVSTLQDYATKLPPLAAAQQAEAAQLAKLTPPASMTRDWSRIVHSLSAVASNMVKVARYADARNTRRFRTTVEQSTETRQRLIKTAARYGFKDCST